MTIYKGKRRIHLRNDFSLLPLNCIVSIALSFLSQEEEDQAQEGQGRQPWE